MQNVSLLLAICSPSQAFLGEAWRGRSPGGLRAGAPTWRRGYQHSGAAGRPFTTSRSPLCPSFRLSPPPPSISLLSPPFCQPPPSPSPLPLFFHPFIFLLLCARGTFGPHTLSSQTHHTCALPHSQVRQSSALSPSAWPERPKCSLPSVFPQHSLDRSLPLSLLPSPFSFSPSHNIFHMKKPS